jgi:hypothetical protein
MVTVVVDTLKATAKPIHWQGAQGYRLPEHVDALLSDLAIDTKEVSQLRVALLSAGHRRLHVNTGMRSVRNVDATRR